jgi:uncharacterized membrane protein YoaK (UPF0700 family)
MKQSDPSHEAAPAEGIATRFFAIPWLFALAMSWTVGVIDAFTFDRYGVFTSNQAGNLVVLAVGLPDGSPTVVRAGLSLLGACLGVVVGLIIAGRFKRSNPMRLGAPVSLAMVVLLASSLLDAQAARYPSLVIPMVSFALACTAAGLLDAPAIRGWITANTGAFLSAVAGLAAPPYGRGSLRGRTPVQRNGVIVTLGFFLGALAYGAGVVVHPNPVLIGALPAIVAVVLSLLDILRTRGRD